MGNFLSSLFGRNDDDDRFDAKKSPHGNKKNTRQADDYDDDDEDEDDDIDEDERYDPKEMARKQKELMEQLSIPFLPSGGVKGVGDLIPINYRNARSFAAGPFGIVLPKEGTWGYVVFTAESYGHRVGRDDYHTGIRMRTHTGVEKGGSALNLPKDSAGFAWRIK